MHTNEKREDPLVELGYEPRDVKLGGIVKATGWFFGFAAVSAILGWIFLTGLHLGPIQFEGMDPSYTAAKPKTIRKIPGAPNPLVQTNVSAKVEISEMRNQEDLLLNNVSRLETSKEKVRIPISLAMDILVARGLPEVQPVLAKSKGHTTSAEDATPPKTAGGM